MTFNAILPATTITTAYQVIFSGIPVNLPGRLYKIECDILVVQNTGAGTVNFKFRNGGGDLLYSIWTLGATWSARMCLHDIAVGAASNNFNLSGQVDSNTASLSWDRLRVFDVGPQ
jgi:hypothetical protein